ncbi:hemin uptake protein HemP [Thiomonas intermedia]|uniref:hemin uptake protein HemP n=1 Tax=Thiomonas intermedia TaxID=926 RepID=UPI0009A4E8F3|nr:hemin uptake protein HemP [Thiomonas intermedia]
MNPTPGKAAPLSAMTGAVPESMTHPGLTLHSRELFRQGAVVQIRHQGQVYQLRLTRQDKLILTK